MDAALPVVYFTLPELLQEVALRSAVVEEDVV